MKEINWFQLGDGSNQNSLDNLERVFGIILPEEYKEFALKYSGSYNPIRSQFSFVDDNELIEYGNFGCLLAIDGTHSESVIGAKNDLDGQLPKYAIPIIDTGCGDLICINFNPTGGYEISYYFHERILEKSLVKISNTLFEFIDMLNEPNDIY